VSLDVEYARDVRKRLFAVVVLLAACGQSALPPTSVPAATPSSLPAASQGSSDPCVHATTFLGAFTSQLASQIVGLRPQIVAKEFDASATGTALLRINATFTAYDGIEQAVRDCLPTTALGPRIDKLIKNASESLAGAIDGSINDAQLQRDSAASLFGLLPEVIALSAANQTVAETLSITAESPQIADAAIKPLGPLPPLAKPVPTRTPVPTGTLGSGSSGGSGSGSGSTDWTIRARAYINSAFDAYQVAVAAPSELYGLGPAPGQTAGEIAANAEEAALIWKPAVRAINAHISDMTAHPALSCYKDAYSADRGLASGWLSLLKSGQYPDDVTPAGRVAQYQFNDAISRTTTFLGKMAAFMADCP
jgi:hypothetical protein